MFELDPYYVCIFMLRVVWYISGRWLGNRNKLRPTNEKKNSTNNYNTNYLLN